MDEKKPKNLGTELNSQKRYESAPAPSSPSQINNKISPEEAAKEFEKLKNELEEVKKKIVKKYPFTRFIGVLPQSVLPIFAEDEAMPVEVEKTNPLLVMICIPEDNYKDIPKIKPEILKIVKESGKNIWLSIKTEVDLWNYGLDSKFDMIDAVSASFPLHDTGFLGALRLANIHKSLVLRKFEKYVASYVIGGSLVRGTAGKESDVDVFVVIDDTDVKRMPRIELLEKLRGIIYDYIREATALSGVKNVLNVQVYLLTDFWQSVKDAHPVMFTFIRDGIPMYDRGTFIPWKLLLQMGKIKPSAEAIDLYMKEGERTEDMVKRRLLDAMVDVYWGIVTPTQAMMMLAGEAPPVPKVLVEEVKKVLVDREKIMTDKEVKILDRIVKLYKQYEYGNLKEIPGKDVDSLLKESKEFNKTLKELRKKIEKRLQERTVEEVYRDVFKLLGTLFKKESEKGLIEDFENKMLKKGKIEPRFSSVLKEIISIRNKNKKKSKDLSQKEVDRVKKDAIELIKALTEFGQRTDLIVAEKGTMQVVYSGNRKAELVLMGNDNYLIEGREIKRIKEGKLVESNKEDFEKSLAENKGKLATKISGHVFDVLRKELGEFEIVL